MYFWDIFLFNQRPKFLTSDEHDYIRDCGDLDGYVEKKPVFSCGGAKRIISGFVKPTLISDQLAMFLGKPAGTRMARTDVSKEINTYIRIHGLQCPYNGRVINPDVKLRKLLRLTTNDELTFFNLQKYMKPHFHKEA